MPNHLESRKLRTFSANDRNAPELTYPPLPFRIQKPKPRQTIFSNAENLRKTDLRITNQN